MSTNDTISIVVTDTNGNSGPFVGYMIMGAKVENPLTGIAGGIGSPLKVGDTASGAAVCVNYWPSVSGTSVSGGTQFTFAPTNATLLEVGAWELTFVVFCQSAGTQFDRIRRFFHAFSPHMSCGRACARGARVRATRKRRQSVVPDVGLTQSAAALPARRRHPA
jgi:hypothetical protein